MVQPVADRMEEKKGRGRGRSRGRPRGRQKTKGLKLTRGNKIESDDDDEEIEAPPPIETTLKPVPEKFIEDCDISSLQAPTFTTLDRGPPAPMKDLKWDHPVNLIAEKVLSPRIHCCDICNKPILIYGRMIPCKHVFCLTCARNEEKSCPRCGDKVARVEQTGLGTVFMCNFSINDAICKRTYLSQRDLLAHIAHRHVKSSTTASREEPPEVTHRDPRSDYASTRSDPRSGAADPRVGSGKEVHDGRDSYQQSNQYHRSFSQHSHPPPQTSTVTTSSTAISHHIPVMTSSRINLINVPLQDQSDQQFSPKITSHPPPPVQLTHPPPSFTNPPPHYVTTTFASPYSSAPPRFTYSSAPPQRPPGPPPFSTPVPVPPPTSYGSQYAPPQWPAVAPPQTSAQPPPTHTISHPPGPPPTHHRPPTSSVMQYYR